MLYKQQKVIILMPPKTGTSSFLRWTQSYPSIKGKAHVHRHHFLSDIVLHNNIKDLDGYKIYQLCRNPLDKLISSFYFEQALPIYRNLYPKLVEWEFNEAMQLKLPLLKYLPQDTKIYFQKVTEASGDTFKTPPKSIGDKLYLPQTDWNDLDADVTYLKLETLIEDSSILSKIFNVHPQDFPFVNATHIRKRFGKPILEMFSPDTLKLAVETYKEDYKILNYDPPIGF